MAFVKVGRRALNLDDVRFVEIDPDGKSYQIKLVWKGEQAERFHSIDIQEGAELCKAVGLEAEYAALVEELASDR